uniref:Uncharacterized protein n=1 Tax=Anguilla anguilla TaxID=7936 RepID=A0A0E9P7I9_ANGAN
MNKQNKKASKLATSQAQNSFKPRDTIAAEKEKNKCFECVSNPVFPRP